MIERPSNTLVLDTGQPWRFDADFNGSFSAAETEDRTHNAVNELLDRNQGTGGPLEDGETLTYGLYGTIRMRVASSVTTTYTHDAWNRLVKVVAGSATLLEQQDAASIGGLSWRTWKLADTNANGTLDEERTFTYDPSWRLVEERVDADYPTRPGLDRRVQHVWGKRYIDDAVLHRRDGNNDGDYLDANEGTWYHLTDAMYSTVALFSGASVVERVTYTPYGEARRHFGNDVTGDGGTDASDQAIVLGAWGTTIGNAGYLAEADLNRDGSIGSADLSIVLSYATALAPGLISNASPTGPDSTIGWDGYVFNPETRLYTVRHRSYLLVLGRWMERDPLGYYDGANLYSFVANGPVSALDPLGLKKVGPQDGKRHLQQVGERALLAACQSCSGKPCTVAEGENEARKIAKRLGEAWERNRGEGSERKMPSNVGGCMCWDWTHIYYKNLLDLSLKCFAFHTGRAVGPRVSANRSWVHFFLKVRACGSDDPAGLVNFDDGFLRPNTLVHPGLMLRDGEPFKEEPYYSPYPAPGRLEEGLRKGRRQVLPPKVQPRPTPRPPDAAARLDRSTAGDVWPVRRVNFAISSRPPSAARERRRPATRWPLADIEAGSLRELWDAQIPHLCASGFRTHLPDSLSIPVLVARDRGERPVQPCVARQSADEVSGFLPGSL